MGTIGNINVRVGADTTALTEEMQKAQRAIVTFKDETMTSLKSFGMPAFTTSAFTESVLAGGKVIQDFTLQADESLEQFQTRVREALESVNVDMTNFNGAIQGATKVHTEFTKGAISNFQAIKTEAETDIVPLGDKIDNVFNMMYGSVEAFIGIQLAEKLKEWSEALANFAEAAENTQRKFEYIFSGMSQQAEDFSGKLASTYGVYQEDIENMMSSSYMSGRYMGFQPEQAEQMSEKIVQLSYDLGKLNNMSPQDTFDALSRAMEGQTKGLKDLGIVISETDIKDKALQEGLIKKGQTLDDATKSEVAYQLILQETNKQLGYYENTSQDLSTMTDKLNASWKEIAVELGTDLLPLFKGVVQVMQDLADGIQSIIPYIDDFIKVWETLDAVVVIFFKDIMGGDILSTFSDLKAAYASIWGTSGSTNTATTGTNDFTNSTNAATDAINAQNAALQKNAMSFDQIHNLQDEQNIQNNENSAPNSLDSATAPAISTQANPLQSIASGLSGALNTLQSGTQTTITAIEGFFSGLWTDIKAGWNDLGLFFLSTWGTIETAAQNALGAIYTFFEHLWDEAKSGWSTVSSSFLSGWNIIETAAQNALSDINTFFSHLWDEAKSGWSIVSSVLLTGLNLYETAAQNALGAIYNYYSHLWDFIKIGWNTVSSILILGWNTIKTPAQNALGAIYNYFSNLWGYATNGWNTVSALLSEGFTDLEGWGHNALGAIYNYFSNLWGYATNGWNTVSALLSEGFTDLEGWGHNALGAIYNYFSNLWGYATNGWNTVSALLSEGFTDLEGWGHNALGAIYNYFSNLWGYVKSGWESLEITVNWGNLVNWIKSAIDGAIDIIDNDFITPINNVFNKIKLPQINLGPLGTYGGQGISFQIPLIPQLASGGIVTSPTLAMVGEAGPEAVVPLSKMNTSNGNQNITLQLDGRTIGRILRQYSINENDRIGTVQGYDPSYNFPK